MADFPVSHRDRRGSVITVSHSRPVDRALERPSAPTFVSECRIPGGAVRLRLIGEVDVACLPALDATLERAFHDADGSVVVLDFGELELLAVEAVRVLRAAEDRYRRRGGSVLVQHVPAPVDRALRLSGLDRAFEIVDAAGVPEHGARPPSSLPPTDAIRVQGELSPWTVVLLQRAVRHRVEAHGRPLVIDLRDASVHPGRVTVMLSAALHRLGRNRVLLSVLGAPPRLAIALQAGGIELPDRDQGLRRGPASRPPAGRPDDHSRPGDSATGASIPERERARAHC